MPILYRFMKAQHALETLESMKLRVGRLADFNDPFDCALHFRGADVREQTTADSIAQVLFKQRSESLGALCFCRTWQNSLLWSHYADSHRGICLVFERAKGEDLQRVQYSKKRVAIPIGDLKDMAKNSTIVAALTKSYTVKSPAWRYEQETRILVELSTCDIGQGSYFLALPKEMIRGCILGLRCNTSPEYIRHIFKLTGIKRAQIWRAKKGNEGFSLEREEA